MNATLTWEEVVARDDIVGGDLETQQDDATYRGRIKSITLENDCVTIKLAWAARFNARTQVWEAWCRPVNCWLTTELLRPEDHGKGGIDFSMPFSGNKGTIFPKSESNLNPDQVLGLQLLLQD